MTEAKLQELKSRIAEISDLRAVAQVLSWDVETYMPPGGAKVRGEQMATLRRLAHEKATSQEYRQLIEELKPLGVQLPYDSNDAALIRVAADRFEKDSLVPTDLVKEMSLAASEGHVTWVKAREQSNFELFRVSLEKLLELKIRWAECFPNRECLYDPILDQSEPGMKTSELRQVFDELKRELVPMVKAISTQVESVDESVLRREYDETKQLEFGHEVVKRFGFDFNRGRQDKSVHPFMTGFNTGDVRITTRVDRRFLPMALFGTMHESGHGMYGQGHDPTLNRTHLCNGASGGMHESQSRLWENLVGRSREFWTFFYPRLQEYFPQQLADTGMVKFYRAINKVKPSFIRTEADEVTYNLHIMLRFELENDMLEGRLKVKDVPQAWNAKVESYLGITPPGDTLGCLQDIHWSSGGIGGFHSYTLGNIISVQLFDHALQEMPDLRQQFTKGEFGNLLAWLGKNVHIHGRKFTPTELLVRVTGQPLTSVPYINYLKKKFGEIYRL
ncbi:MAG: carboxypeptidase M32 [Candidatus Tectomicrobia bacterium]|nr:carboxypeptidase M32 [Candidatus Tectomicrobia bacterium]